MRLYNIIGKPVVTEKTSNMKVNNTYTVEVLKAATKIDIKKAFKEIYGVEVTDVRVVSTREKFKNARKGMVAKRKAGKKAYVTLKEGNKLDFTDVK